MKNRIRQYFHALPPADDAPPFETDLTGLPKGIGTVALAHQSYRLTLALSFQSLIIGFLGDVQDESAEYRRIRFAAYWLSEHQAGWETYCKRRGLDPKHLANVPGHRDLANVVRIARRVAFTTSEATAALGLQKTLPSMADQVATDLEKFAKQWE
jgi:hypothetical protein